MSVRIKTKPEPAEPKAELMQGNNKAELMQAVEQQLLAQEPMPLAQALPPLDALNGAARLLLELMPERSRQVMIDTADQQRLHLWMLVVGILQRAYDMGEHTAPVIDPVWTHTMPAKTLGELAEHICELETCNAQFRPRWPGQQFCSTKCGNLAAVAARSRQARGPVQVRYQVGEEPPGTAKSCITVEESDGTGSGASGMGAKAPQLGGQPTGEDPISAIERAAAASIGA